MVVLGATTAAGCAVNPVSGRSEVAVLSADKERERFLSALGEGESIIG